MIAAVAFFVISFIIISTEKINKTVTALIGAAIFIIAGWLSQETAFHYVDWNVIFLLVGMMIIVGITKETGLFQYIAIKSVKLVGGHPVKILISQALITAVLSAFLDNVTTVLILCPIAILVAVELGLSPTPYVINCAIASNIGGTATLIGDPPNILIGSASGLDFVAFITNLGPAIVVCLAVYCLIVYLFFRKRLVVPVERRARVLEFDDTKSITDRPLLIKSLVVILLVIAGFLTHGLTGLEPATIALGGAAVLMLLSGKKEVEDFFREVEWGTIFFFVGLFMMVGGLEELGVINLVARGLIELTGGNLKATSVLLVWGSGTLSAVVDNIPYVATMIPLVEDFGRALSGTSIDPLWWSLALGACLGGNGTLIGASANVVSAGVATKSGYKISFLEFTKYGVVITVITLAISTLWVLLVYF